MAAKVTRARLRPISGKKRQEIETRKALRVALLRERGPWCQAHTRVCAGPWTDMHEVLARSQGGSATDPGNILCVCRACHDWIGNNRREAREMGLIESRQCHG